MFYVWQMNGRWQISALGGRPGAEILADSMRIYAAGFDTGFDTEAAARAAYRQLTCPATEPTDQGLQYVIPGCEKDRSRGPNQADLF